MTAPDAARLADWRALAEAATPGPWESRECFDEDGRPDHWVRFTVGDSTLMDRLADAEFIAAAREAVPALLDAVERLRADVDVAERQANNHAEDAIVAERERDALRAELSAIHATTEWQRWARAVTERDVARAEVERLRAALDIAEKNIHDIDEDRDRAEAAVRRVEALLDRGAVCCGEWGCSCRDDVRAALAGPGATT